MIHIEEGASMAKLFVFLLADAFDSGIINLGFRSFLNACQNSER